MSERRTSFMLSKYLYGLELPASGRGSIPIYRLIIYSTASSMVLKHDKSSQNSSVHQSLCRPQHANIELRFQDFPALTHAADIDPVIDSEVTACLISWRLHHRSVAQCRRLDLCRTGTCHNWFSKNLTRLYWTLNENVKGKFSISKPRFPEVRPTLTVGHFASLKKKDRCQDQAFKQLPSTNDDFNALSTLKKRMFVWFWPTCGSNC